jgi:tRNA-2-methylthio-N6-dimethylallyladenosine synthase
MNFNDREIVASILKQNGFSAAASHEEANLILLNTCSIREKAEQTVRKRLTEFRKEKEHRTDLLIGILGCMAERLKTKLLDEEQLVDIVAGPDAYRSLPALIKDAESGQKAVNVLLSREETYADIAPVRLHSNGVSAFISIMRGCNNMCSFCVVPFTRGRERSRNPKSIIQEANTLFEQGYKEITLLGQNVDSYYWIDNNTNKAVTFHQLLEQIAQINPQLRVRFSTSHPKDITDEVLFTMQQYENICKYIHLPVQSGSTRILQLMNRTYSAEWYKNKIQRIKTLLPDCGISSDIIAGFCTETEEDHEATLNIMQYSAYDMSYMFCYSERPGTLAARKYKDDVPEETKKRRLQEIIALQNELSLNSNRNDIGKTFSVLIEGESKRSHTHWMGRTSQNKVVVFPKISSTSYKKGDYVNVKINDCTQATLLGNIE